MKKETGTDFDTAHAESKVETAKGNICNFIELKIVNLKFLQSMHCTDRCYSWYRLGILFHQLKKLTKTKNKKIQAIFIQDDSLKCTLK